jgi:branched-chain amino acid transport system substrate-binding protein
MSDKGQADGSKETQLASTEGEAVSRRQFLAMAGIVGAAVGMGAGLGGLVAACGSETTTTTAAASTTISSAATTTLAAGTTTTVAASVEEGREIKVGLVAPKTGALASFAIPVDWIVEHWKAQLPDGVVAGDGKKHQISVNIQDTQSDSNRAAQVAGDLIQNAKVDVVFASGSPDTCNPAADQCEANGTLGLFSAVPSEPWFFGRGGTPEKPFKWTWCMGAPFFGLVGSWVQMWGQISNNKKVGMFFANSSDGLAFSDAKTGAPFFAKDGGYEIIMPALYAPGTEDFTAVISQFKKAGCEICASISVAPDFTNFWKQAVQQGFYPKIMTCGLALLFEETVKAIGPSAIGLSCECTWHPSWPYKDSLSGMTCQELADKYEADTGRQWTMQLNQLCLMEWFVDALKRSADIDDKQALVAAVSSTNMINAGGPINFTDKLGSQHHPMLNVVSAPMAGGQWRKGTKWEYEMAYLASTYVPGSEAVPSSTLEPIQYS